MSLISLAWKIMTALPARAWTSITRRASHDRDLEYLLDCDNRTLADIGLLRSHLLAACNQPFWRDPMDCVGHQDLDLQR
jgi:uncharacterized protein YjiS (DUF1127 family)